MLSTDGSVTPCEGRPERASKAGCGAVIGAAPRLGWTDVGRIGHGLDRGATTSAMTLGLRGILERIREGRSNGTGQKIRGEWVVFAMVDSETCVKGMEKAWRSRDDSWLVGEEDGDLGQGHLPEGRVDLGARPLGGDGGGEKAGETATSVGIPITEPTMLWVAPGWRPPPCPRALACALAH